MQGSLGQWQAPSNVKKHPLGVSTTENLDFKSGDHSTITPYLTFSIESVTLSAMTYNESNLAIG